MDWNKLLSEVRVKHLFNEPVEGAENAAPKYADPRSQFLRDYDRAIFSAPVRRLQDKAQVFPMDPTDAVRTRLTHSLEVSSVARGLASSAAKWMLEEGKLPDGSLSPEAKAKAIETIAETCGLIHDLGNPPFGHAGEQAISSWFSSRLEKDIKFREIFSEFERTDSQLSQDFLRFEGNAQTCRLISRFQLLANNFGLNFTSGTQSAASKYIAKSNNINENEDWEDEDHPNSKPGYFASENELIDKVRQETGTEAARNPITYLIEASDDIVYSVIDIEDGIKKGVLSWQTVENELMKVEGDTLIGECIAATKTFLREAGLEPMENGEAMSQAFRTTAIGRLIPSLSVAFQDNYDAIMAGTYKHELYKDSSSNKLIKACKSIAKRHIYSHHEILRLELMGRKVIHDLMDLFWEGASVFTGEDYDKREFSGKILHLMSPNYRKAFALAASSTILPINYLRMQLMTDYICGMTDSYACRLHRELTNG